jgi:hypothetical protein
MSKSDVSNAGASRPVQPIAQAGGDSSITERAGNPYQSLDELMMVVEALCKTWPSRTSSLPGAKLLL